MITPRVSASPRGLIQYTNSSWSVMIAVMFFSEAVRGSQYWEWASMLMLTSVSQGWYQGPGSTVTRGVPGSEVNVRAPKSGSLGLRQWIRSDPSGSRVTGCPVQSRRRGRAGSGRWRHRRTTPVPVPAPQLRRVIGPDPRTADEDHVTSAASA